MKLDGLTFTVAGIILGILIGAWIAHKTSWLNAVPIIGAA